MALFEVQNYITSNDLGRWEGESTEEAIVAYSRYYPVIRLCWLRKPAMHVSQDILYPGRDSKLVPPKYQSRAVPLDERAQKLVTTRGTH
jgi:hypothetical protein